MSHLTVEQRYVIESLLVQNKKKSEIALIIGVSKSTVTREIQRNSDERSHIYRYKLAQSKSEKRKQEKPKKTFFTSSMKSRIKELIEEEYSPEQITGFCRINNEDMVSYERIYQYIWADKKTKGTLFTYLRCKGRRYRKRGAYKDLRGIIINRIDIDKGPRMLKKGEFLEIWKEIPLLEKIIKERLLQSMIGLQEC